MTPAPDHPIADDRAERIARLIDDLRAATESTDDLDDPALMAAHPELMPELGRELLKLRRVREAARLAAQTSIDAREAETATAPLQAAARALASESHRHQIRAPGYSILRELARGGQAVVFLALKLNTGRRVALKVMRDGPLADERAMARFRREVQVLASLNHPNIVTIFDTGQTDDGSHFLAMDYIAGRSLDEYLAERHDKYAADPGAVLRLFLRICAAVSAAHLRGIVHRDLKPTNIRIDDRGEPHVLDFGLARGGMNGLIASGAEPVTVTGEFLGSLPWSSPEQADGDPDRIDFRSDVYSLGVILYQMLTGGRFPYVVVGNIRDVLNNILTAEPTPPSKATGAAAPHDAEGKWAKAAPLTGVNATIEAIVLKALSKRPERRYETAGEMGRDVASYLAGQQTAAPPQVAMTGRARPHLARHAVRPATAGVLAVVIAAVAVGVFWGKSDRSIDSAQGGLARPAPTAAPFTYATPALAPTPPAAIDAEVDESERESSQQKTTAASGSLETAQPTPPSAPDIPTDARLFEGRHFKVFTMSWSWSAAAARCEALGGHLARADTPKLRAFLQGLKGADEIAWVGGSADTDGVWRWTDGTAVAGDVAPKPSAHRNYTRMFLTTTGGLSARPDDGRIDEARVPIVTSYVCEWDR